MKIAYIINGQLRVKNAAHAAKINNLLKGGDVYLVTYPEYIKTATNLTHKQLVICNPPKLPQDGLYQYYTLQYALRQLKETLLAEKYDFILRYRTDLDIQIPNLTSYIQNNLLSNRFYAKTDWMFCGGTNLFIELFENVYDKIMAKYIGREKHFTPINWSNLKTTLQNQNTPTVRWGWINYPEKYFSLPLTLGTVIESIDKYSTELNALNTTTTPVNTITYPNRVKQRMSRPLSTEKFIVTYVTCSVPIYPLTMPFFMPAPHERNKWKL